MFVSSNKRVYQINLNPKIISKVLREAKKTQKEELQRLIDYYFTQASNLSLSCKGGAWAESKVWRDKGKLLLLYKEGIDNLEDLV